MILTINGKEVTPGIDISHHQGSINWDVIQNAGLKFVFIKATQDTHPDPLFSSHWNCLNKNSYGLVKAAYHFFDTSTDPEKQAETFSFVMGGLKATDLPPVVDIEQDQTKGALSMQDRIRGLSIFLTTVQQKTGRKPLIYTYNSFFSDYFDNSMVFSNYPLWIASYPDPKQFKPGDPLPTKMPRLGCGFKDWEFWQYTENGFIDGADDSGNIFDLNVYNGSLSDLQAFCQG